MILLECIGCIVDIIFVANLGYILADIVTICITYGLTVCCNGTTRWTVDENAKEVYIENVAPGEEAGNIIRGYLKDIVNYSSGKDSLKGVVKRDGNTVEVNLQNIRISEPGDDMSRFTFDTGALDPAIWIVNDLR